MKNSTNTAVTFGSRFFLAVLCLAFCLAPRTPMFAQESSNLGKAHLRIVVIDASGAAVDGQKPNFDQKSASFRPILVKAKLNFANYRLRKNLKTVLHSKNKEIDLGDGYFLRISGKLSKTRVETSVKIFKKVGNNDKIVEKVVLDGKVSPKFGKSQPICLPMKIATDKKIIILTADKSAIADKDSVSLD